MSETVKVSKETKQSLLKIAARLQEERGERVDFDEAIRHLVSLAVVEATKRPVLLERAFGSVPGLSVQDLYKERRLDEQRAKRKYRL